MEEHPVMERERMRVREENKTEAGKVRRVRPAGPDDGRMKMDTAGRRWAQTLTGYSFDLVLGKFGPRPIGTRSGPDQTPWSRSQSGIFPKTQDHLVSGLGIPLLLETVSDLVLTGTP